MDSTRIVLGRESETELSVLDASGPVVSPMYRKRFAAGRHEIFWNATDADCRSVSSGVNLIRILTPDHLLH